MTERLQKILARAGIASRRAAEDLITEGRVTVNGKTVRTLGVRADASTDKIVVDGAEIRRPKPVWVLLHKPDGVVTTLRDPQGRPTVSSLLPARLGRLFPVGRLDFRTSGLLLLTNDGEAANRLLHPSSRVARTYRVKVSGVVSERTLERLRKGVRLDDGVTGPAQVSVERRLPKKAWLHITIREGRRREIRRMLESVGHPVDRLIRIRFGTLDLRDVGPGEWRRLSPREVSRLLPDERRQPTKKRSRGTRKRSTSSSSKPRRLDRVEAPR